MVSPALISELQEILATDFGINADQKETANISNSLTKYFEILLTMSKNEKPKITVQKFNN